MGKFQKNKDELADLGFSIIKDIFSKEETDLLIKHIQGLSTDFSIRQLVNKSPEIQSIVFSNSRFREVVKSVCDEHFFLTKAIYFNKPSQSNWFVSYHQDLSISVKEKMEYEGFFNWTRKKNQIGVVPPTEILANTVTIRIHLDDANIDNGALKVIERSHQNGIIRVDENFDKSLYGNEVVCNVERGGVMLMKLLLLHASQKSISQSDRRVIHLEFSNQDIPMGWLEQRRIS